MRRSRSGRILWRAIGAVCALFPENYWPERTEYRVESNRIPAAFDGFRLVQLSDLHGRTFGHQNSRLLAMIRSAAPNAVVMTGDMTDRNHRNNKELIRFCKEICAQFPAFYITGNHEQELDDPVRKKLLSGLRSAGVRILERSSVGFVRENERIRLCGLGIPMKYYRVRTRSKQPPVLTKEKLCGLLGSCGNTYTILLAHNPFFFEAYAEWGADLTLCGHVHGGIIRLPHFGGLLSPERRFFPKYSAGLYRSRFAEGKQMIVSRGLGKGARVGNRPELAVIVLRAQSDSYGKDFPNDCNRRKIQLPER